MLKKGKRILATVLSFVLFANTCLPTFAAALPVGSGNAENGYTVTEGELVAIAYSETTPALSEAERNLLSSAYIDSATHTYNMPTKDLITIDQEELKVTVKMPETLAGQTWAPIKAELIETTGTKAVELNKVGDVYEGEFSPDTNTYTVKVEYELAVTVSNQAKLLNTPKYLKDGVDYLTERKREELIIEEFQKKVPEIVELGSTTIVMDGGIFGQITISPFTSSDAAKNAITNLKNQMDGDNELTIYTMMKNMGSATSGKLNHIINTDERLDKEFISLYNDVDALKKSLETDWTLIALLQGNEEYKDFVEKAQLAKDAFPALLGILEPLRVEQPFYTADMAVGSLDSDGLAGLASLVDAVDVLTDVSQLNVTETLKVGTVSVEASANLLDATIVYEAEVSDGTENLVPLEAKKSPVVKVSKEMADQDIIDQLTNNAAFKAEVLAAWNITAEELENHFTPSVKQERTETDFTYTVSYVPKMYTVVENWGSFTNKSVPYGYVYNFAYHPDHSDTNIPENDKQGYVYTINGTNYDEGTTVVIVESVTINRAVAKAKQGIKLTGAVGTAVGVGAKEQAVLDSAAVKPNTVIKVQYPGATDVATADGIAVYTKGEGVKAKVYDSGYDFDWVPYQVTFDGTPVEFPAPENGEAFVGFTGDATDVVVTYRLQLNVSPETAKTYVNYPSYLSEIVKQQYNPIFTLRNKKGELDEALNTLKMIERFVTVADGFPQSTVDAFTAFTTNNFDANDNLKLSNYLGEFLEEDKAGKGSGLIYFYGKGEQEIKNEIETLAEFCEVMKNPANQAPIEKLLDDFSGNIPYTYSELMELLAQVTDKLNEYNPPSTSLVTPIIDINQKDAAKTLFASLVQNSFATYDVTNNVYLKQNIKPFEEGKANITFKVVVDGKTVSEEIETISSTDALLEAEFNNLMKKLDDMKAAAVSGVEKYYYGGEVTTAGTPLEVGKNPSSVEYTVTWNPVKYTIYVEGNSAPAYEEKPYTSDLTSITFGIEANHNLQYTFTLPGVAPVEPAVGATSVTIPVTAEQLHAAATVVDAANGNYEIRISRTSQDVSAIEFEKFVTVMNTGFEGLKDGNGANLFGLMPYETATGEKAVVMRATYTSDMNSLMNGLSDALLEYPYVALGEEVIWSNTALSVQAIVDTMLKSGVGMDTFTAIADDKGNINQLNVAEEGLVKLVNPYSGAIKDADKLGGKLLKTTIKYGSSESNYNEAIFYLTIEHFNENPAKEELLKIRNSLVQIAPYVNVNGKDGNAEIVVNLPDEIYQIYLTSMLLENEITLDSFNTSDMQTLVDYFEGFPSDVISGLAAGEKANPEAFFTALAIENTIREILPSNETDLEATYGKNLKIILKLADLVLNKIRNEETEEFEKDSYKVDLTYDNLKAALEKFDKAVANMVVEDELNVSTKIVLKNINKKYDAYVAELPDSKDVTKEDLKKLLKLSTNVADALNKAGKYSYIILLEDVDLGETKVNIKGDYVVIDLNGHAIKGDMNATGKVMIVDNTLSTKDAGKVDGAITGNFTVYAGNYKNDVTSMLAAGHTTMANGEYTCVRNAAYLLNVDDAKNEYQIILEDDIFDSTTATVKHSIVNAVFNVAANFYGYNTITVSDSTFGTSNLFSFGNERLIDLVNIAKGGKDAVINEVLEHVYPKAVEYIANGVLNSIKDLDAIANNTTEAIYSVALTMAPWDATAEVTGTGLDAYVDIGYKIGSEIESKTLAFYLEEEGELRNIAQALGDVIVINEAEVKLGEKITYNGGKDFSLAHEGKFDVALDLTPKGDVPGSENYPIILATVLGYSLPESKAAYVNGVNSYIAEGKIDSLKEAIDNTTLAQLITALENANGVSFKEMLNAMGYTMDADREQAITDLEAKYSMILNVMYKLFAKADLTGDSRKLGAYDKNNVGEYYIDKTAYGVTAKVGLKLFTGDPKITALNPQFNYVGEGKQIYKFHLDETQNLLILDTRIDGITKAELEEFFQFETINSTKKYLTVDEEYITTITPETGVTRDVIKNGAKFTIVAANDENVTDERTYTLIILGDTNSNGMIEVGDAAKIRMHVLEILDPNLPADDKLDEPLTDAELIAGNANMGSDNLLEVGDCVLISSKWISEKRPGEATYSPEISGSTHIK